jgi:hypothetical protein
MKEYEYRVEGLVLVKCDVDTGEEVLDKEGRIQLYIHHSDEVSNEYGGAMFEDHEVQKLQGGY